MNKNRVGRTNLFVPPLIVGTMARRKTSSAERISLFRLAYDSGLTAFDTAPLYDFGDAEEQLGTALASVPHEQVQILTKVGLRWNGPDYAQGSIHFEFVDAQGAKRAVFKNSRPDSIRWEVEQSLKRLRTESVDLVQIHFPDVDTPIAESIGTLIDLRNEGKLKHIGVSNFDLDQIKATQFALGDEALCSVQSHYNLIERQVEKEIAPYCAQHEIGMLAYSPLAEGILAGKPLDSIESKNCKAILAAIRTTLAPIANGYATSLSLASIYWLIRQNGVSSAIVGLSTIEHLQELLRISEFEMKSEDIDTLTRSFAGLKMQGTKSNPGHILRRGIGSIIRKIGLDPARIRRKLSGQTSWH